MSVTIVNVGHRSTNYWVISAGRSRLLVDIGWPGRILELRAELDRKDIPIAELRYAMATHYHMDHAGAAEDLKRLGVPLLVLESQLAAIPVMKTHTKPADNYTAISLHDNVVITFDESRRRLVEIGIQGQIVPTPGHSDDSVTLLLDTGDAFVGDLMPPDYTQPEGQALARESWARLRELGARMVYPGHGPPRRL